MNIVRKTTPWFSSIFDEIFTRDFGIDLAPSTHQTPAVNITEKENAFHLELVAPGKEKKDFDVELEEDTLTISTTTDEESSEDNSQFTRREFDYASFQRSFRIPETIDTKNIKANYKNGLLSIILPKRKEAIPEPKKQIEIR
ncbi:MAG: Hsp20/alpha crystallin family protein [Flavobacteriaceae bacterium]